MRSVILGLMIGGLVPLPAPAADEDVPPAFAAFEHLVGAWKGTALPAANRVRGWPERHRWAWTFAGGRPVGLTVAFEGSKTLASGTLGVDASGRTYRLEGKDPAGKPVVFEGRFGPDGKLLALDRVGAAADGSRERLTLRLLPDNKIRYVLWLDRRERGAPAYKRAVEVGLTREGESFAAGGSADDLPKCVVTGGAATMSVSFEGASYPICCSGCLDEFRESPAKYIQKAKARAARKAEPKPGAKKPRPPADDDAFDGLVDEPQPPAEGKAAPKPAEPKSRS